MKDQSYLPPEAKAYTAFLAWLDEGKKVWSIFDEEGVPVPSTLKRALSDVNSSSKNQVMRTPVREPEKPEMPPQAHEDWLWIEVKDASLRTLVLAILNEGKSLPIKDIIKRVKQIDPNANEGSIYNIGSQEEKMQKTDEGWWRLQDGVEAPILFKNHIWAPADLFQKQDLAAFRRMAVRHLLAISSDGLQIMQVYRQLKDADWLRTPKSKDLIKADLLIMKKEKRVKTLGHSKKWTLINKVS